LVHTCSAYLHHITVKVPSQFDKRLLISTLTYRGTDNHIYEVRWQAHILSRVLIPTVDRARGGVSAARILRTGRIRGRVGFRLLGLLRR
jgi:hypothetical protein